MKKTLIFAAAALLMSACSNEVTETFKTQKAERTPISLSTYTPGLTRAESATVQEISDNGFWLVAGSQDNTFESIDNKFVVESGVWMPFDIETSTVFTEPFYWPTNPSSSVDFYALYSPSDNYEFNDAQEWRVNADGETDFLYATATQALADDPTGTVALNFKHILGAVKFKVVGALDGYNYTVSDLSIETATSALFDIFAGEFVADTQGTPAETTVFTEEDELSFATPLESDPYFFIPVEKATLSVTFAAVVADETMEDDFKTVSAEVSVVPGAVTTYIVQLNPDKVAISFNVKNIEKFTSGDTTTYENNEDNTELVIPMP